MNAESEVPADYGIAEGFRGLAKWAMPAAGVAVFFVLLAAWVRFLECIQ